MAENGRAAGPKPTRAREHHTSKILFLGNVDTGSADPGAGIDGSPRSRELAWRSRPIRPDNIGC